MSAYLEVSIHPEYGVALLVHREVHWAHYRVGDDSAPVGTVEVAPLDPGLLFSHAMKFNSQLQGDGCPVCLRTRLCCHQFRLRITFV